MGVPDHIDLEPKSKNILHVDEFGRELTDSLIYERLHHEDSIEVEKNQIFSDTTENNEMNFNNNFKINYPLNKPFIDELILIWDKYWALKPKRLSFG